MEYLTLGDFERYGGIKGLDSKVFERYEMKARRLIDRMTHNRLQGEKTVRKAVTMCMVELVGAMAAEEADGGAGSTRLSAEELVLHVEDALTGLDRAIVLLHDDGTHSTTVEALPGIIVLLQERAFALAPLTPDVKPVLFAYSN